MRARVALSQSCWGLCRRRHWRSDHARHHPPGVWRQGLSARLWTTSGPIATR